MDTCEKTPCRYPLALRCPCFLNTWTPDYPRHRGPLPGGQVLPLELRSLLTFIYVPAHVFPSLVSKCSVAQGTVATGSAHNSPYSRHFVLAAILF